MMCQPNSVLIGSERSPVFAEKTNSSKGATVRPLNAVNLPPSAFEAVSWVYFFASFAKSAPPWIWSWSFCASASFFTRMWRTSREAGCWYLVGFLS